MRTLLRFAQACLAAALVAATVTPALAQGHRMSDKELSEVWGQALLNLTNTSVNGLDFTRITLGADIQFNANFNNMRLGEYNAADRNATGADIDISRLSFGRSDGTDAQRTVHITDPYFEFVYSNAADPAKREVVGMRLGFGGIQGDLGVQMNAVSGSLLINTAQGNVDSHNDPLGGKRWDGSVCATGTACGAVTLPQIGQLTAGDANGASRDFFISVLRQAVQFPTVNGVPTDKALQGIWMNWRDRLVGSRINQGPPPNLPKPPGG
jgi:hypothetical protein